MSLILASLQRKESAKSSGVVEEEQGKKKKAISASLCGLDTLCRVLASRRQIMLNPVFGNTWHKEGYSLHPLQGI